MTMTTRKLAAAAAAAAGGPAVHGANDENTENMAPGKAVTSKLHHSLLPSHANSSNNNSSNKGTVGGRSFKCRSAFIDITNAVGKGLVDGKRGLGALAVRKPSLKLNSTSTSSSSLSLAVKQRKTRTAAAKNSSQLPAAAPAAAARRSVKRAAATALAATANELARLSKAKKTKKLRSVPTLHDIPAVLASVHTTTVATAAAAAGGGGEGPVDQVSALGCEDERQRQQSSDELGEKLDGSAEAKLCDQLHCLDSNKEYASRSNNDNNIVIDLDDAGVIKSVPEECAEQSGESRVDDPSVSCQSEEQTGGRPVGVPDNVIDFDSETDDMYSVYMYASEVFSYYKECETRMVSLPYLTSDIQPDLTESMRAILVDWMVEVQESFELNHETLYTAVRLVDLYLARVTVARDTLQLIGATALFIACKFDERLPPPLDDFLYICEDAYSRHEVIHTEMKMLQVVDFQLGLPISYRFLRRYARCCRLSMETLTLSRFVLEMSLMEYSLVTVRSSLLAAAALSLALLMKMPDQFSTLLPTIQFYSGYSLDEFRDVILALNAMLHKPASSHLKTIRAKYSHKVFFEVAKIPLLDSLDL